MTIKDLKKLIQNLPDDMDVMGYNGGNGDLHCVDHLSTSYEDSDGQYPNGVFVVSID